MIKDNQLVKYQSRQLSYYGHRLMTVVNAHYAYLQQETLCESFQLPSQNNITYLPLRIKEFADGMKQPRQIQFVSLYNSPPIIEYYSSWTMASIFLYDVDKYHHYYKLSKNIKFHLFYINFL